MGFLRPDKIYRAPCRWYPGGPIGQIEYYIAAPGATFYTGANTFRPLKFWRGETNEGVGELTGNSVRRFWSGIWNGKPDGHAHVGTANDFAGLTAYPGPTTPDHLPVCAPNLPEGGGGGGGGGGLF